MARKTRMKGGGFFDGLFGSKSAAADKAVADAAAAKIVADKAAADAAAAKIAADKAVADAAANTNVPVTNPVPETPKKSIFGFGKRKTVKGGKSRKKKSKSKSRKH